MKKLLLIIVTITAGIIISTRYIESHKLTQGPDSRPAAQAQQLDNMNEDQINTLQAAPLELSK